MKALHLLPLLLLPLIAPGCATMDRLLPPVAAEADPIVVRSQQLASTAMSVVDAFLKYEKANRAALQVNNISLKAAADSLRMQFPPAYRDFQTLITLYKGNRTPQNRDLLTQSIENIRSLSAQAEVHLAGGVLYPASPNGFAPPPQRPQTQAEIDAQEIKTQLSIITERLGQLDVLRANNARIINTLRNHGFTNEFRAQPPPPPAIGSTNDTINPNAGRQNR